MKIPFNKPFLTGNETAYIEQAVASGKISGDGIFTKKSQALFEHKYGFHKTLLTTSCTDALEMAGLLCDIKAGDEVIVPSFTFVSTANAFVLRGATIVFADSEKDTPNIDCKKLERLITKKTRVIVPVHYAGVACDMDAISRLAKDHHIMVVEDAAQAIDSQYKGKFLGSIGHLGAFSFHETKNIISGEGGMLAVNDEQFSARAEIIREKGTNRSAFFRGEIDKYGWVDIGSSFLPSEIIAAFLFAQLENIKQIQKKRHSLWVAYNEGLQILADKEIIKLPFIPAYATNNAHMYYVICRSLRERNGLIDHLRDNGIHAVFHYLSLHRSAFYCSKHDGRELPFADRYSDCIVRLPMFYELTYEEVEYIVQTIKKYFS
jgi:dTDP-4-amino-4,6-dideoxygalactose transaminase